MNLLMRFLVFGLVAGAVTGVVYFYMGMRVIEPMRLPPPWRAVAWGTLTFFWILHPLAFGLMAIFRHRAGYMDAVQWVSYTAMGFFCMLLVVVVLKDVAGLGLKAAEMARNIFNPAAHASVRAIPDVDQDKRLTVSRMVSAGALMAAFVLTGAGFVAAHGIAGVKPVRVRLRRMAAGKSPLRVVQISDIHVGPTIKRDFLQGIVEKVNSLNPDIIAVTGDLVDGTVEQLRLHVEPLGLLKARLGVYFVTGNHEYYSGAEEWIAEVRRLGLTVLMNEHVVVEHEGQPIVMAGVTDYEGGRFFPGHQSDPRRAIAGAPEGAVKILLAHQPRTAFQASEADYDLQLSGHTHGGQFIPWNLAVRLQQPVNAGLHLFNQMWIYVSRGTGYWGPPLRLGAPSEITLLEIAPGESPAAEA
ncbi:MAG: hypothetical protein GMKNLPBB_00086 [Myxococcota bacterium]|nr:hypothetical protein [Myxococcota bacterium]